MPFAHSDKKAGDLIRSADWNAVGSEVMRLERDKVNRVGEDSLDGPLTVRGALSVGAGSAGGGLTVKGDLAVGTVNAGATVRVLKKQEDGRDAAHGALVLGTDAATSAALRIGYFGTYSWLQGQGQQTLALNPHGGSVGVGTPAPASRLTVGGNASIGAGYTGTAAPANGLIVQGYLGVGVAAPVAPLHVLSDMVVGVNNGQRFIFHTRQNTAGDFLQITNDGADGNWNWNQGITLKRDTGHVGVGTNQPVARLHVAGGALRLDTGQEIFFVDNGQIRSLDNNHRILFRRTENKLELREWGDLIFSSGAKDGNETARAVLTAAGNLGVGTTSPTARLQVVGDALVSGSLGFGNAVRQMVNLWGTEYGIGVQSSTTYLRTGNHFAFYRGGSHNDAALNAGGGTALATLASDGTLTAGAFTFGNGSTIGGDQGGHIELGGNNGTAGTGTPYIDFHFRGKQQDFNTRIINDGDGVLTVQAGTFAVRDCFAVSLACADFLIGHPTRRKTPGRALVDGTSILYLNYDSDWSGGCQYWTAMTKVSTREIKQGIEVLDGSEAASLLHGLDPVRYRLIGDPGQQEHLGFIAEEVPDAIAGPDHKSINESHIVAVLTRVVKEQQRRLDTLTERLNGGM